MSVTLAIVSGATRTPPCVILRREVSAHVAAVKLGFRGSSGEVVGAPCTPPGNDALPRAIRPPVHPHEGAGAASQQTCGQTFRQRRRPPPSAWFAKTNVGRTATIATKSKRRGEEVIKGSQNRDYEAKPDVGVTNLSRV